MQSVLKASNCERCHRLVTGKLGFSLRTSAGDSVKCLRCALRHVPMLKRSLMASIIVGSALVALNQGDLLFTGQWVSVLFWKIPLTYLVPFLVATWGVLSSARQPA